MSSRSLTGSEFLLRMTVTVPVSVATLPIGSSVCAGAGAGAAGSGVCGVCGACACASRVEAVLVSFAAAGRGSRSVYGGIAETCCVPPNSKQPKSGNVSKNRYVTMKCPGLAGN